MYQAKIRLFAYTEKNSYTYFKNCPAKPLLHPLIPYYAHLLIGDYKGHRVPLNLSVSKTHGRDRGAGRDRCVHLESHETVLFFAEKIFQAPMFTNSPGSL